MVVTGYIIYVVIFLVGLIPTLIALWLNERVKGSVKSFFDAKLEVIKKVHSKEISQFQTELSYLKSKENFKFTKLHEKRFEVQYFNFNSIYFDEETEVLLISFFRESVKYLMLMTKDRFINQWVKN